uniref:Pentacotripeptide-repeat region of PRORP domain-containing protein n=1 Tax=Brassica campestris TaxID=3711 RepID=A0A3P6BQN6_BRACM|nr:unnamed protein product [Brassica rapa]
MSSRGVVSNKDTLMKRCIRRCYRAGRLDNALEVVAEMVREGYIPDGKVFERLADALSEVNREEEAAMMITFVVKSGIKPSSLWPEMKML